ncbi:BRCT domain-containing protein [Pseudomonas inefficax]|uniref:BRCT domain-containing protein n=1 Tax=Pseudomonas inefficax TaxID=2078786 RepID=UPI004046CE1E
MSIIKFRYCDAKGVVTERELVQWSENSSYIQGRSSGDTFPKTFRKDRIEEFLLGEDLLLKDAAPPAPKPKPSDIAAAAAMSNKAPKKASTGPNVILFTGFPTSYRSELEVLAEEYGMKVVKTPSKTLTFLCYGDNAGPSKVAKAQEAGAFIVSAEDFLNLIQTGELP